MSDGPTAKRPRLNPSSHPAASHPHLDDLQAISNNLQQIKCYVDHIHQKKDSIDNNVSAISKLKGDLQSIVEYLDLQSTQKHADELLEVVARTTQVQLSDLLCPMSMIYLASTCKKMFSRRRGIFDTNKICDTVWFDIPEDCPGWFRHWQPKRLSNIVFLSIGLVPSYVTEIRFDKICPSPVYHLPPTITHLTFGELFNHSVSHILPPSLTHLTFGDGFNQRADYFPAKLTHLTFGLKFEQSVENLPKSLVYLEFARGCQYITKLPNSLRTLKFKIVELTHYLKCMPLSLTSLEFGELEAPSGSFWPARVTPPLSRFVGENQYLEVLPVSLTHLKLFLFGLEGGEQVEVAHLTALQELTLAGSWNDENPPLSLPPNLVKLEINCTDFTSPLDNLPETLTHLTLGEDTSFNSSLAALPTSVTHLLLNSDAFSQPLRLRNFTNLTHLSIGYDFDEDANELPDSLTHLSFGVEFYGTLDRLPPSITHLMVGENFQELADNLPPLTHLMFGVAFDYELYNLPQHSTYLTFGERFNQRVDTLPHSVTHLAFGAAFDQPVDSLPPRLVHLSFGRMFSRPIDKLPSTLQCLRTCKSFHELIPNLPALTYIHMDTHPKWFPFPSNLQEVIFSIGKLIYTLSLWKHNIRFDEVE